MSIRIFFKQIFICCLLTIWGNQFYAQQVSSNLCDYSALLNGVSTIKEKQERENLYLKMLGLLDDLSKYRNQFILNGDLVNLFPTVYYHTTYQEIDRIRMNTFDFPIEKMRQMLFFYDSYISNRKMYDMSRPVPESHWKKHFKEVDNSKTTIGSMNLACDNLRKVVNSAIRAHVKYDLGRAIKYAFDTRVNKAITPQMLLGDFLATNSLFAKSQELSVNDINIHSHCGTVGSWVGNQEWLGAISTDEVIAWREEAFKNAIISPIPLLGYDGQPLLKQTSYEPHEDFLKKGKEYCDSKAALLFLFDVSGSMADNNKWNSAKQSALSTLQSINTQARAANTKYNVGFLSFDGECVSNPTRQVLDFTANFQVAENAVRNKIPPPGGGTPLPQAIQIAKDKLSSYLAQNNLKKGKLIILTDGESTCGAIRPADVYGYGQYVPQTGFQQSKNAAGLIKYYAVGFDIAPGSNAEKDLQYLAQSTGGKYLNAQNQAELTSAFQKFSKVYIPKPRPSITAASSSQQSLFNEGLAAIEEENYTDALVSCQEYVKKNGEDYNGIYNLALMYEANERFKMAIKFFELYLQLNAEATDREPVKAIIASLQIDAQQYYEYSKKVVKSDLQYLDLHFKKIQNGESVALALEFIGFLKEKYSYYRDLPEILGIEDRLFKTNANEVFKGLKQCVETIKRNPQTWDRDATPVLSRVYLNMERLLISF